MGHQLHGLGLGRQRHAIHHRHARQRGKRDLQLRLGYQTARQQDLTQQLSVWRRALCVQRLMQGGLGDEPVQQQHVAKAVARAQRAVGRRSLPGPLHRPQDQGIAGRRGVF